MALGTLAAQRDERLTLLLAFDTFGDDAEVERRRQQEHGHQIEAVGRELRSLMPFLDAKTVQQS